MTRILVVVLFVLAGPVMATNYYVDQNHGSASDSNAGTSESLPWLTLDHATDVAAAGDSVIVKAGVYIDQDQDSPASGNDFRRAFDMVNSGTSGNPIVIVSRPALACTLRIRADHYAARDWYAVGMQGDEYIVLDGFYIDGGLIFYSDQGQSSGYNTVKNCELVRGTLDYGDSSLNWGITMYGSSNNTISNNYVHDIVYSSALHNDGGIMLFQGCDDNIIEYNTVDGGTTDLGVCYGQKAGLNDNNIYRYNLARNAPIAYFSIGSTGGSEWSYNNTWHNNIAVNVNEAFTFDHSISGHVVYNNTAHNIGTICFAAYSATNFTFYNNIFSEVDNNTWTGNNYGYLNEEAGSLSSFFADEDYNYYYTASPPSTFAIMGYSTTFTNLSAWVSGTSFGDNSTDSTNPSFVNAGGSNAGDYKRSSYPTDGHGGAYPSVVGAYVTGSETIGYTVDGAPPDDPGSGTLTAPTNLQATSGGS